MESSIITTATRTKSEPKPAMLDELIKQIQAAIGTESFYTAGKALETIREEKLYLEKFDRFSDFTVEIFDLAKSAAYAMIAAARFVDVLRLHGVKPEPEVESQARPMSRIKDELEQVEVWRTVIKHAPGGKITAAFVKDVVDAFLGGKKFDPEQAASKPKQPKVIDAFLTPMLQAAHALEQVKQHFHGFMMGADTNTMDIRPAEETLEFFRHELGRLKASKGGWKIDPERGLALFEIREPIGETDDPKEPALTFAVVAHAFQPETSTSSKLAAKKAAIKKPAALDVTYRPALQQPKPEQAAAKQPAKRGRKPNETLRAQVDQALRANPKRTHKSIAEEFGCSLPFVRQWRRELGLA